MLWGQFICYTEKIPNRQQGKEVIEIRNRTKLLAKLAFVIILLVIIIYTFRDSAKPILTELAETSVWMVVMISVLAVVYELVEGWITYSFAKKYNPAFTYQMGVESAFYCSFYRVATLGSGAGIAAIYYFNEKGIEVSKGTGMYMVEYVLHKVSIAIFSAILFLLHYSFMMNHYGEYTWMLVTGYGVTLLISMFLLLFCCSKRFHHVLLRILDRLNRNGRLDEQALFLRSQCVILEQASAELLRGKRFVFGIIGKNLIKFVFWYGIPYFVLMDTGLVTLPQAMAVTSLSVMLAAVLPSPAGIGSTEFVFTMLFEILVGTADAGSATLLYRFATFVLPFLIGAVIVVARRVAAGRRRESGSVH